MMENQNPLLGRTNNPHTIRVVLHTLLQYAVNTPTNRGDHEYRATHQKVRMG